MRRRRPTLPTLVLACACAAGAPAAQGEQRAADGLSLLPTTAFQPLAACPLDPFVAQDPQGLEQRLDRRCNPANPLPAFGGPGAHVRLGPNAEGRLAQDFAWGADSLNARLRLGLAAQLESPGGTAALSTRAELSGGLWWQPVRQWAMNLRFGGRHEGETTERRVSLTQVWRPSREHVLFSRWRAGNDATVQELGLRWWLVPRRLSFDLLWPASGDDPDGARLRLDWRDFKL